jgi:hypothetical protein
MANPTAKIICWEYSELMPFGFSMVDHLTMKNAFIHFSSHLKGLLPSLAPYIEIEWKTNVIPPLFRFYREYISTVLGQDKLFSRIGL